MWIELDDDRVDDLLHVDSVSGPFRDRTAIRYLQERIRHYQNIDTKLEQAFRKAADEIYGRDGELEIDENAVVSLGGDGNGAYVMAWRWVYNSEAGLSDEEVEAYVKTGAHHYNKGIQE